MSKSLFVNLPVADIAASRALVQALGFEIEPQFSDDSTICAIVNEHTHMMLIERSKFAELAKQHTPVDGLETNAMFALGADSREAVDATVEAALATGATPNGEPQDHGFMYSRGFYDLDGHHFDVLYMDPAVLESGEMPTAATV